MQQQIAGHAIQGRITYPQQTLLRTWASIADERMAAYADLEARIRDYWKQVYLAQQTGTGFQGTVRRIRQEGQGQKGQEGPGPDGPGKVWLEELMLLVDADLPPGAEVGQTFNFYVKHADPEHHILRVAAG
jgi:hypothetical protein